MLAKKIMKQDFQCKYCSAKFHKATTLHTHMCVKKQRYLDTEQPGPRIGFRAFQRFYELTTRSKNVKSVQDFIDSPYYIDFAKFGNHLATLKPMYTDKYIEFVIMGGVKLKDWTKDSVYDLYIVDLVKKEPAESATDRSITTIIEWCTTNNILFDKFFVEVNANEAAYMIKVGKISPWVLYLAESGEALMSRFNEDHSKMIGPAIDAGFWMRKFKKDTEDVIFIRALLEQAGL